MVLIVIWLLFGIASGIVLSNKGRSGVGGFFLGMLLGPIGLIIALVMSPDEKQMEKNKLDKGHVRKCRYCSEIVKMEAIKCKHCGSDIEFAAVLQKIPNRMKECSNCKKLVRTNAKGCKYCNTKLY